MSNDDGSVDLLLVESNTEIVEHIREGLENARVHSVETGDEALDFLFQRGKFVDAPLPNIVLLATDLPDETTEEVLRQRKQCEDRRAIPVVVLAGSTDEDCIKRAYDQHANACVEKPSDPEGFRHIARSVSEFWLSAARLPNHRQPTGRGITSGDE